MGNALAEELPQGVHVVGVDGHDVPVGVGVKIPDGEGFHVGEQLVSQLSHGPLADVDHDPVVGVGCGDAQDVESHDPRQSPGEGSVVWMGGI